MRTSIARSDRSRSGSSLEPQMSSRVNHTMSTVSLGCPVARHRLVETVLASSGMLIRRQDKPRPDRPHLGPHQTSLPFQTKSHRALHLDLLDSIEGAVVAFPKLLNRSPKIFSNPDEDDAGSSFRPTFGGTSCMLLSGTKRSIIIEVNIDAIGC